MSISSIPQNYTQTLLGGINTVLSGSVGANLGGELNTNLRAPDGLETSVALTAAPMTVELGGIPDHIALSIDKIPEIELGITKLPPIELRLTEMPSIRAHLPAAFNVGLSILGVELLNVSLCGEAQIITEPYRANPCEGCEPRPRATVDIRDAISAVEQVMAAGAPSAKSAGG